MGPSSAPSSSAAAATAGTARGREGASSRATRRISRVVPFVNAPYAAAYSSHVAAAALGGGGIGGRSPSAARSWRLMNHMANDALVCHPVHRGDEAAAGAASASAPLQCDARVPPRRYHEMEIVVAAGGTASGMMTAAAAPRKEVYEVLEARRLPQDVASKSLAFGPSPTLSTTSSAASSTAAAGGGAGAKQWPLVNHFPFDIIICEVPDAGGGGKSAGVAGAPSAASAAEALFSGATAALCLPTPLGAGATLTTAPLADRRKVPRPRVLAALRPVMALPPASEEGAAEGAAEGDGSVVDVGIGATQTFGVWAPSAGFLADAALSAPHPSATAAAAAAAAAVVPATPTTAAAAAEYASWTGDALPVAARPERPLGVDATCAAHYGGHAGVGASLAALRSHWADVTAAVRAGEVVVDLPPDAVELGTDADPVRRLLLTLATAQNPGTHPLEHLAAQMRDAPRAGRRAGGGVPRRARALATPERRARPTAA